MKKMMIALAALAGVGAYAPSADAQMRHHQERSRCTKHDSEGCNLCVEIPRWETVEVVEYREETRTRTITEYETREITEWETREVTEYETREVTEYENRTITEYENRQVTVYEDRWVVERQPRTRRVVKGYDRCGNPIYCHETYYVEVRVCKRVPVTKCERVPVTRCVRVPVTKCVRVPVTKCVRVPVTKCVKVPVQREICETVRVPHRVCKRVYKPIFICIG